jgi:hypothetical protein
MIPLPGFVVLNVQAFKVQGAESKSIFILYYDKCEYKKILLEFV